MLNLIICESCENTRSQKNGRLIAGFLNVQITTDNIILCVGVCVSVAGWLTVSLTTCWCYTFH